MNILAFVYAMILAAYAVDHTKSPMGCTMINYNLEGIRLATDWTGLPHTATIEDYKQKLEKKAAIIGCKQCLNHPANKPVVLSLEEKHTLALHKKQCGLIQQYLNDYADTDISTWSREDQALHQEIEDQSDRLKCLTKKASQLRGSR